MESTREISDSGETKPVLLTQKTTIGNLAKEHNISRVPSKSLSLNPEGSFAALQLSQNLVSTENEGLECGPDKRCM